AAHDQLVAAAIVARRADADVIAAARADPERVLEAVVHRRLFQVECAPFAKVRRRVDHDAVVGGVDALPGPEIVVRAALAPVLPVEIELDVALELAGGVEELVATGELRAARQGEVDARLERLLGAAGRALRGDVVARPDRRLYARRAGGRTEVG